MTYFKRAFFSTSLESVKLSKLAQTWTRRLVAKNPPAIVPDSRNFFALRRVLGLGFNNFLNKPNTGAGIEPLDEGPGRG